MTPLETVRKFVAALERKDIDAALALVSADVEYDNVPMGKNFGPESIRNVLTGFLSNASEVEWVTHREAETGTVVFNERVDRFHFPHGWVELPVTGVWEVINGKITLWRDYFDANMYLKQMPPRT
jgi:limonene-1,2-epoxide hydrolase